MISGPSEVSHRKLAELGLGADLMAEMFDLRFDSHNIYLRVASPRNGFIQRLLMRRSERDLEHLSPADRDLIIALADLRLSRAPAFRARDRSRPHSPFPPVGRLVAS